MKYTIIFALLGAMTLSFCFVVEGAASRAVAIFVAVDFFAYSMMYAVRQPQIFLKRRNGSIHLMSYLIFAPLHLLNWLSLFVAIQFAKERPHDKVLPNLLLGRRLLPNEAFVLARQGELAVLDLTCEFAENKRLRGLDYLCLPVLDHTAPTKQQITEALVFVEERVHRKVVFVHCALGHGRSATMVAAWLLSRKLTPDVRTAIAQLQSTRRGVKLETGQKRVLEEMFPGTGTDK